MGEGEDDRDGAFQPSPHLHDNKLERNFVFSEKIDDTHYNENGNSTRKKGEKLCKM